MEGRYSTRSPAVKRLMREAQELCEPTDQYFAQPLEDNLFEWHFTIRGPADSDFQAGIYHGRIILPVDYPMKPPSIIWLTPNGRFETNKKICLSISGHHPESWQPSWSIRTALLAIIGFMPTHPGGAIGSLDYKPEERKALAKRSHDWKCPVCGDISEILPEPAPESAQVSQEAKELASQISFQGEKPKSTEKSSEEANSSDIPKHTSSAVPDADGVSNAIPTGAPPDTVPASEPLPQHQGNPIPWLCPPVAPSFNSTVLPPFFNYPWTPNLMTHGSCDASITSWLPRFPYPPSHYTCLSGGTQFYPAGFAPFPGMGLFPRPFPQPQRTVDEESLSPGSYSFMSVNNSSASPPGLSPGRSGKPNTPHTPPNIPPPSPESVQQPASNGGAPDTSLSSPVKVSVLTELLKKVKRVGSDEQVQPDEETVRETCGQPAGSNNISASNVEPIPATISKVSTCKKFDSDAGAEEVTCGPVEPSATGGAAGLEKKSHTQTSIHTATVDSDQNSSTCAEPLVSPQMDVPAISEALNSAFGGLEAAPGPQGCSDEAGKLQQEVDSVQVTGTHHHVEDSADQSQDVETEKSVSLKQKETQSELTGMEISHSVLSAGAEETSESGVLTLDVSDNEQKSNFDRSTSSSVPNLKTRLKQGSAKGLRQRQSATASLSTEVPGDEQASDQAGSSGGRQRIEAVSGDSSSPNRFIHAGNVAWQNHAEEVQHGHRQARVRQARSPYDTSFFVMVGLCLATLFILLNRLYYIVYFSHVF